MGKSYNSLLWKKYKGAQYLGWIPRSRFFPVEISPKPNRDCDSVKNYESHISFRYNFLAWFLGNPILKILIKIFNCVGSAYMRGCFLVNQYLFGDFHPENAWHAWGKECNSWNIQTTKLHSMKNSVFYQRFLKHWAIFLFDIRILVFWHSLFKVFKLIALTLQTGFAYLKTFLDQWIIILVLHHKFEYTPRGYTHLNDSIRAYKLSAINYSL